ncbi:MAG TPA: response regulator, partial [Candidatus Cloacimonadota bacterium]|nr:response regulator [Candidatus Cloacimonadota bacterium]
MIADARVLVVDDDDIILSIISNILIRNGYQVDKCHSGEEALEKVDQGEFDLVLLDVHMGSGLDGYDTCQLIQQKQADLPVILVTANQDDESVNKGFESGSSDYIKKPVSRLELLARVKNTITLKRSEKRNLQLIETLRRDLTIASSIQKAMLPKWISVDGDLVFSSYYQASDAVGGDLFDR